MSYVNCIDTIEDRQNELRGVWHFDCQCPSCQDYATDSHKKSHHSDGIDLEDLPSLERKFKHMQLHCEGLEVPLIKSANVLQQWHYQSGSWSKAIEYGLLVARGISFYLGEDDEDLAWVNCCIGKSYLELGDPKNARKFLGRADQVYKVIPGTKHPYYQRDFAPLMAKL